MARLVLAFCILGILDYACSGAGYGSGRNLGNAERELYNEGQKDDSGSGRHTKGEEVTYGDHRGHAIGNNVGGNAGHEENSKDVSRAEEKHADHGVHTGNGEKIPNAGNLSNQLSKSLENNGEDASVHNKNTSGRSGSSNRPNYSNEETQKDHKNKDKNPTAGVNTHDNQRGEHTVIHKFTNHDGKSEGKRIEEGGIHNNRNGETDATIPEKGREYDSHKEKGGAAYDSGYHHHHAGHNSNSQENKSGDYGGRKGGYGR